mgnify:CR=1 FL=1
MYKILIVPSSDDERSFEDVASYEEALNLKNKLCNGSGKHEFVFDSKEEREIFIKGYEAGVGYLGDGLYYTNN